MRFPLSDLILAAFLILCLLGGWRAGTVRVLGSFAAPFIAYGAARFGSGWLAWLIQGWLPRFTPGTEAGEKLLALLYLFCDVEGLTARLLGLVAFLIIFFLVLHLVRRLAKALHETFDHGLLGHVDRLLGAAASLAAAAAVILILGDVFFPVLAQLGATRPQAFLDDSQFILPALRRLLLLI